MSDIYLYEDVPVLKNKLDIRDEKTLDLIEAEQSRANMMILYERGFSDFTPTGLRKIHQFLFGDIYDWAGQYRIINIEKRERLLGGRSVWYSNDEAIPDDLEKAFTAISEKQWEQFSREEFVHTLSRLFPRVWQVHPFREGNTRTVVMMMTLFLLGGFELRSDGRLFLFLRRALGLLGLLCLRLGCLGHVKQGNLFPGFGLGFQLTHGRGVIQNAVNHVVVLLGRHFSGLGGAFLLGGDGKGVRSVAHDKILTVLGLVVEAIACGLQLLPAHVGYKEATSWGLDALAGEQFPWRKLFFPLQEELRHRRKAEAVTVMGFLLAAAIYHNNIRN